MLRRAAYYFASNLSASATLLPLKPVSYPSLLPFFLSQLPAILVCITSRIRPSVKYPVGKCVRKRSDQLCAVSVGAPSNTNEHLFGPASQVFLTIVLRLRATSRWSRMYHVNGFATTAFQPLSFPLPASSLSRRPAHATG